MAKEVVNLKSRRDEKSSGAAFTLKGKRDQLRKMYRKGEGSEGAATDLFTRYIEEDDSFVNMYDQNNLIQPPYNFDNLWRIFEESDTLQACVEAMQLNVDGFGFKLQFMGDDATEKDKPEYMAEYTKAKDFFNNMNGEQSITSIRKLLRQDREVLGCCCLEMVRNLRGELQMMFHIPMRNMRMAKLEGSPVSVPVRLRRDGKMVSIKRSRYFRKFAQVAFSGSKIRWFKEYGDPRFLDATTGEYKKTAKQCKVVASEVMFDRIEFGSLPYGMPRWIGAILQIMGRRKASFVNYDLFDNQGIPPMAVMVSGGVLSEDSIDELEAILRGIRGVEQWNRVLILESVAESTGLEDKGSAKIELKNMSEYRAEDMMFRRYMDDTEKQTRHRFRLPPLYIGAAETFTHATAKAAQNVAEEQVFIPERQEFDEPWNLKIVQGELGITMWKFVSKGPRIVGADEISKGVNIFSKVGGFTINHAIKQANEAFNLDMSEFDKPWANLPLPVVTKLIEQGYLTDDLKEVFKVEEVKGAAAAIGAQLPTEPKPGEGKVIPIQKKSLPMMGAKAFKSDMFSEEEQSLYALLVNIQRAIETGTMGCDYEFSQ